MLSNLKESAHTSSREYFLVSGKKKRTEGSIMTKFIAAKKAYVPHPIVSNIGPVAMTTKKLNSQFEAVERALAGARILRGVTSAGYSQVIPNHPIENQVLNKKRQRTETTCAARFPALTEL
jgi:hypothetical protein